jgi:hypothetical protein
VAAAGTKSAPELVGEFFAAQRPLGEQFNPQVVVQFNEPTADAAPATAPLVPLRPGNERDPYSGVRGSIREARSAVGSGAPIRGWIALVRGLALISARTASVALFALVVRRPDILSVAGRVFAALTGRMVREWRQLWTIPALAAFVGWFTNWVAVRMIFAPLQFVGIPIRVNPNEPLGLIGWRGIVPAKAGVMSGRLVNMVTTELISVDEILKALDPQRVADLLAPEIDDIVAKVAGRYGVGAGTVRLLDGASFGMVRTVEREFVAGLIEDMQTQGLSKVLDVKECVVRTMTDDRRILVELFRSAGSRELRFLTNSGLWVGFILGHAQIIAWLLCKQAWTLPAGGAIVGYLTNWIALKWIFEPVDPVKIGPVTLQGMFLRESRREEVAKAFSEIFVKRTLTAERLLNSIFTGPRNYAFRELVRKRIDDLKLPLSPETVDGLTDEVVAELPSRVHVLYEYFDGTLGLREKMEDALKRMTPRQFERVLHPVFEEDELTLTLSGGALGAAAGVLQTALS